MPTLTIPCPNAILCPGSANPIDGISTEAADDALFTGISYAMPRMPLGANWGEFGAMAVASSETSQADADASADYVAGVNAINPPNAIPSQITPANGLPPRDAAPLGEPHAIPTDDMANCSPREKVAETSSGYLPNTPPFADTALAPARYANAEQTATVYCPPGYYGTPVSHTIAAGQVFAHTQEEADNEAYALALSIAQANADAGALICNPNLILGTDDFGILDTSGEPFHEAA